MHRAGMNAPIFFATGKSQFELVYIWDQATPEAKVIIFFLIIFSVMAWFVMISKAIQMRQAKKLNLFFTAEFRSQKAVLDVFDRRIQAEACPLFKVYQAGSIELDARLKNPDNSRKRLVSIKGIEHVKRTMENAVAQESLRLESGLILLAIAVSGAPFLGLLGTVWGVMDTFTDVAVAGSPNLTTMAPGISGALITTVTALCVAIPAMFGYNFLVTSIRGIIVEMDNFAAELASEFEHKYVDHNVRDREFGR
jgi:biopolymer transport protein TolQ